MFLFIFKQHKVKIKFNILFKVIVCDSSLAGPIGSVATKNILQKHDVIKTIPLKPGRLMVNMSNVMNFIFITRPLLNLMDMIAENIRG